MHKMILFSDEILRDASIYAVHTWIFSTLFPLYKANDDQNNHQKTNEAHNHNEPYLSRKTPRRNVCETKQHRI